ncbi:thaumatin-like protein 1 isoform X2 [Chenopodium quinoa]|uniref:thaumatin-like protein 1 isoform X2 n=1 Tax=Chenopodium quinoa TaxID=63459 RepID=UPI000B77FEF7|nr:thaumatin-like protein 1 isoform X2 [Chenopodium quinoa]
MEAPLLVLFIILILITVNNLRGVESIAFTFKNNCPYTIWPGTLSGAGSPILSSTGFELPNGATFTLDAPTPWSGRFWARSLCQSDATGKFRCSTGDCGSGEKSCNGKGGAPPATLAEFTLGGSTNKDFYDISLVDGFNLPLSVVPQGGTNECPATSCAANLNIQCPETLSFKDTKGSTIGCKSACLAFNQPQYCCTGEYKTPQTCPPTNQSLYFKNRCPQAYSYAYDDSTSTFTCPTGVNYLITFCP